MLDSPVESATICIPSHSSIAGALQCPNPQRSDERELRTVSDAIQRGMTTREIATILYGEPAVSQQWSAGQCHA